MPSDEDDKRCDFLINSIVSLSQGPDQDASDIKRTVAAKIYSSNTVTSFLDDLR